MAKRELDRYLATKVTTDLVSLFGRRAADRYGDAELAVLAEMPALERCALHHQQITHVPRGMRRLTSLSLGETASLASLDGIADCASLQSLKLHDLPALDLERACDLLVELPELAELDLSAPEVPAGIAKLPSLISLSLWGVADLANAFDRISNLSTLRRLRISADVLPDAFGKLARIEALTIHRASALPASIAKLARLEELVVTSKRLRTLPPAIRKLGALKRLVLDGTKLGVVPEEVCELGGLEVLDLSQTQIRALPAQLGKLANLRELHLGSTLVKKLPESIGELANLRKLDLPWKLKTAPASFAKLSLEEFFGAAELEAILTLRPPPTPLEDRVYISDPDRIPDDFGDPFELVVRLPEITAPLPQLSKLRRLVEVELDVGNLADALARLAGAVHLRTLEIAGERVAIPDELGGLAQLTALSIESGSPSYTSEPGTLEKLPKSLGKLARLARLQLGRHHLATLPDELGELAALRTLKLGIHGLKSLPAALGKLQALVSLELDVAGKLARLPPELARCATLAEIDIDEAGEIANLDVLATLPALRSIRIWRGRATGITQLIDALAGGPIEELKLGSWMELGELPAAIGKLGKLKRLELPTKVEVLPPAIRACSELRWIMLSRKIGKDQLPAGRWKKGHRSGDHWFERTD